MSLLWLLLFLPCAVANESPVIRSMDAQELLEDRDKVSNDFLLWTTGARCRSRMDCATSCALNPDCAFFTISIDDKDM
jgi:hypothetical protein